MIPSIIEIARAIRLVQAQVRWKPGNAQRHLAKRIRRGHLPAHATQTEYDWLIQTATVMPQAQVYVYSYASTPYVTLLANLGNQTWLVMFGLDGQIESASVVDNPRQYLARPEFDYIGRLDTVVTDEH